MLDYEFNYLFRVFTNDNLRISGSMSNNVGDNLNQ